MAPGHAFGNIVMASDDALMAVAPEDGKVQWTRPDLKKVTDVDVHELEGTPVMLVSERVKDKLTLHAIDVVAGSDVWKTDTLKDNCGRRAPAYSKGIVLLLTTRAADASKDKPDMIALKVATGEVLWQGEFPEKVDLHSYNGKTRKRFDLSGHQPPLIDGDSIYFTYGGLHRYDINTGKLLWSVAYDVTEGNLKLANAQAIIDGDTIYTSAKGQVRAIDRNTGKVLWKSKEYSGAIAQMIVGGDIIYGRIGGNFLDWKENQWMLKKPLGVVAIDKKSGGDLWRYEGAKEAITNMMLLEDHKTMLIADQRNLIGLDLGQRGKIKEAFTVKLEFKNKTSGGAKAARTAMKAWRGGLIGKGGLLSHSGEDDDPPVKVTMRENGIAVVQAAHHLLAFDPKTQQSPWSVEYAAPGISGWKNIAYAGMLLASAGVATGQGMHSELGTSENNAANRNKNESINRFFATLDQRHHNAANTRDKHIYVVANLDSGKPGVVAVDLENGQADGEVALDDKEPKYEVDAVGARLYQLHQKELVAYPLQ